MTASPERLEPGWWASLRHGGLLIAPSKLVEHFPVPPPPLAEWPASRLRRDLLRLRDEDAPQGALLDTIFETVLGLEKAEWTKGSDVDKSYSKKMLTGETVRPRRVWRGTNGAELAVFVPDSRNARVEKGPSRLGVGRGRRAVAQVVEWLRRADRKVAILTNGRQLRLVHAGADYDAFCEWDTDLWFQEGTPGPQVTALRALLSREALSPPNEGEPSPLLRAIQASRQGQAELSFELGERVRRAVESLIRASAPVLHELHTAETDAVSGRDIYIAATRMVMRCVVILFAEARELLPRHNVIYEESYGLQGLRGQLDRTAGGRGDRLRHRYGAWPRLVSLFQLLYEGSAHEALQVPKYGGGLFAPGDAKAADPVSRAVAAFESPECQPSDAVVHRILELLCTSEVRVRQGNATRRVQAPVDFSDLSSEYLGILYEGLLDFELRRAPDDDAIVFLTSGNQPALPLTVFEHMPKEEQAKLFAKLAEAAKKASRSEEDDEDDEDEAEDEAGVEKAEATAVSADAEPEEAGPELALADDHDRAVDDRAHEWACKAVDAAKLVKYPKKDTDYWVREKFKADRDAKARSLIARVVLPGDWYLVRWGGTRKGSGTFYTRPQLAGPIVRRALEPLIHTDASDSDGDHRAFCKPEEILALKVCDPAMGSGSFLIAALRSLTEALLESLYQHGRLTATASGSVCRLADGLPAEHPSNETLPVPTDAPDFDDRLRARLKRHVVERCIYGVDLDPLAVELARTALWVETMDEQLPFGFLDHKLKCGNSLVGCWFDQFEHYPVAAWEREGGDKSHKDFVHHFRESVPKSGAKKGKAQRSGDKWTHAIKECRNEIIVPELRSWLMSREPGQRTWEWSLEGKSAADLVGATASVMAELHALAVHETEKREQLYRTKIVDNPAFGRLRAAFDAWCATWFWPAEKLDIAPTPKTFLDLPAKTRTEVGAVAARHRFFHWELEFPDVFRGPGSGFDAVVGNPPWEIQKPNSLEFFSNIDPLYRTYGKEDARKKQREYFESRRDVETSWLEYSGRLKATSNWTRNAAWPFGSDDEDEGTKISLAKGKEGEHLRSRWRDLRATARGYADPEHPFRHQGSADINSYKMFLETAHCVVRTGGVTALVTPASVYGDQGSQALRTLFMDRSSIRLLYAFQNERRIFEVVHHAFKMCVLSVQKGTRRDGFAARFRLGIADSPDSGAVETDLGPGGAFIWIPTGQASRFSPRARTIIELRTAADLTLATRIFDRSRLMGDEGGNLDVTYARELDMTNDAVLFPPRPTWDGRGYRSDVYGNWLRGGWRQVAAEISEHDVLSLDRKHRIAVDDIEDVALPLCEGRSVGQFDFQRKGWLSGKGRRAKWRELPWDGKAFEPQFLISRDDYLASNPAGLGWKVAFMDVAASNVERTTIATALSGLPCGNSAPVLLPCSGAAGDALALTAIMNSFCFDYYARLRCTGLHMNWFVVSETPVPRSLEPSAYTALVDLAAGLGLPALRFAPFWRERAEASPGGRLPWRSCWAITAHERTRRRAMLDAICTLAYGLTEDDLRYILQDTDHPTAALEDRAFASSIDSKRFWLTDRERPPEIRHSVLSLVAFRELERVGLDEFLAMNDGAGWMLPGTLRLADYGLGHDDRAKAHQPVACRLGERFLPWQLEQGVEESWEECRRHAALIERIVPSAPATTPAPSADDLPVQKSLFGDEITPAGRRKKRG